MDKETGWRIVGFVALALALYLGWSTFFTPRTPAPPPAAAGTSAPVSPNVTASEPASAARQAAPPTIQPAAAPETAAAPGIAGSEGQAAIDVKTQRWEVSLSARGGRVLSWKLLDHASDPSGDRKELVDLVSPESRTLDRHPFVLVSGDDALDKQINGAWYLVERTAASADELATWRLAGPAEKISFRFAQGGIDVRKLLVLPQDGFQARVEWSVTRQGQPLQTAVSWGPSLGRVEVHPTRGHERGNVMLLVGDKLQSIPPAGAKNDLSFAAGQGVRWVAVDDSYFVAALIPDGDVPVHVRLFDLPENEEDQRRQAAIEVGGSSARLFAGPKIERELMAVDANAGTTLVKVVPWGFFGVVAQPLYKVLAFFHGILSNWGLAIIAVTILIRLAFYPLTQRSMVSMRKTQAKMSKLQPKLKRLREKYEGKRDLESRQKMNQEMMALYGQEGINPLSSISGCLPMLLQLPVLYAMYTVLTIPIELRGAPFVGWVHDLSAAEPFPHLLLAGMVVTMFVQQFLAMTKTEDPQMKAQQRMMLIMPLMFSFVFYRMPAGLVLYWFVNNLLGIGQQWLINRQADRTAKAS